MIEPCDLKAEYIAEKERCKVAACPVEMTRARYDHVDLQGPLRCASQTIIKGSRSFDTNERLTKNALTVRELDP